MKNSKQYDNGYNLVRKDKLQVYHQGIDFLTIRISTAQPLIRTLNGLVANSDIYTLDHGFRIRFFGLVAGSQLKVLHINDSADNLIAYIHIKQDTGKKNKNFATDIEFVGLFWTSYSEYLEYFCTLFDIDKQKKNIVTRIDYCVDIAGLEVQTLLSYCKDRRKTKDHVIRYGKQETYSNIRNDRHELVAYNKKLDILEKNKHKIEIPDKTEINEKSPYLCYIKEPFPITRIEYRKKARALRELVDNSINSLFDLSSQMMIDYFATYYELDLGYILNHKRKSKPRKEDVFISEIMKKKASFYWAMVSAYADNYALQKTERELFKRLYEKYGERIVYILQQIHNDFPTDSAFWSAEFLLEMWHKKEARKEENEEKEKLLSSIYPLTQALWLK